MNQTILLVYLSMVFTLFSIIVFRVIYLNATKSKRRLEISKEMERNESNFLALNDTFMKNLDNLYQDYEKYKDKHYGNDRGGVSWQNWNSIMLFKYDYISNVVRLERSFNNIDEFNPSKWINTYGDDCCVWIMINKRQGKLLIECWRERLDNLKG